MEKVVVFAIMLSASGTLGNDIFRNDGTLLTAIKDIVGSVATTLNGLV